MAATFFRAPAVEWTDLSISAQELLGTKTSELESRLAAGASAEECMRIMTAAIGVPGAAPNPVRRGIEAMTQSEGLADLDRIACHVNLSPGSSVADASKKAVSRQNSFAAFCVSVTQWN